MNTALIFAFTGDDSKSALKKFKEIGMIGAIIKPIDINIINKLMNSLEIKILDGIPTVGAIHNIKIIKSPEYRKHFFVF